MAESKLLTIGEVADRAGVATSALRFYGRLGLIAEHRTEGGQRRYRRDVLRQVAYIQAAQRMGLQLEEIAATFEQLDHDGPPTAADWASIASSWRPRLDQRIEGLTLLRDSLDGCIGCGCLSIDSCAIFNIDDRARAFGPGARFLLGDDPKG